MIFLITLQLQNVMHCKGALEAIKATREIISHVLIRAHKSGCKNIDIKNTLDTIRSETEISGGLASVPAWPDG